MFKAISIISFQFYRKTQNSFQFYRLFGENVLPILCSFSAYILAKSCKSFADDK